MNGLRRWLGAWFLLSDVRKTIRALEGLAPPYRSNVARKLGESIDSMVAKLRSARERSLGAEQDCWQELMLDAVAARQASVSLGANSRTNPQWAKAALSESWLTAATGRFGSKGASAQKLIDDFIRAYATNE